MKKSTAFLSILLLLLLLSACSKREADDSYDSTGFESALSDSSKGGSSSGSAASGSSNNDPIPAGQITAGEWNDLDNWSFWSDLLNNDTIAGFQDYWKFFPAQRYTVMVQDETGTPVADSPVQLTGNNGETIWTARTDNSGKAELWANLYGGTASTPAFILSENAVLADPQPFTINYITYIDPTPTPPLVEVAFIVDATGSMGDEITYLKSELTDVLTRIQATGNGLSLRAGSVFYRDNGDEYVTQTSPLTTDFNLTQSFVNTHDAGGGGDFPEAVDQALDAAIHQLEWSDKALARIAFLVLDAPPHHDDQILESLQATIRDAAAKGIKVIPVTASGIDRETEFLMRYLAMSTNGTYVFITNHSGIGNTHIEATVGEYEVEFLNDLMVRLVEKYSE